MTETETWKIQVTAMAIHVLGTVEINTCTEIIRGLNAVSQQTETIQCFLHLRFI